MKHVSVTETQAHSIELATREQAKSSRWFKEREKRITASTFPQIVTRKTNNHDKFIARLISSKHTSTHSQTYKGSLKYGIDHEDDAIQRYYEYMQNSGHPVKVFTSGLIVNPDHPHLGCTPDRKVFDPNAHPHFGLAEVKCLYTLKNLTPTKAANYGDKDFPCEYVGGKLVLKADHAHMIQVQSQMAISGTKWCDYILFTIPGLHVVRVYFDQAMWVNTILPKVESFYFNHFAAKLLEFIGE
jgi:hypothetical protein